MERLVTIDQRQQAIDELLAFEIADFAELEIAAQMIVAVGVTAGAMQRALARDFNRHRRRVAGENPSPCRKNRFHRTTTIALGSRMQRRTLLHWAASCAAVLPFQRIRALAQPRELTPAAIATLHEIATTVLPASLGADRVRGTVDKFVQWTRGYREGVPLAHGYGHPRLQKTGTSPVPGYVSQLAAIESEARTRGGRFSTLDLETRRALLDA